MAKFEDELKGDCVFGGSLRRYLRVELGDAFEKN
jgi:hypothetical protein